MDKRNWKIYYEWIEGKEYDQLAKEFELKESTIKEICTSKIPDNIKTNPNLHWQRANSYRKYRQWQKKLRAERTISA